MKTLDHLIIHYTGSSMTKEMSAQTIIDMHTRPRPAGRGWSVVGYSAMIHLDGKLEYLRDFNENETVEPFEITNGAIGMNDKSRHIVYVGGMTSAATKIAAAKFGNTLSAAQEITLLNFITTTIHQHPNILISGHNDHNSTGCPGFVVSEWLRLKSVPSKNIYSKKKGGSDGL